MSHVLPGAVVRLAEPLAAHTAWRTGGPCDAWLVAQRRAALGPALDLCREQGWKVTPIGAGTRAVARDGGIAGAVLRLGTDFAAIERQDAEWVVGAAVPVPALVQASLDAGLAGVEALARVPGSVGASVLLDTWPEVVREVCCFHRGRERWCGLAEARGRLVTAVRLALRADRPEALAKRVGKALGRGVQPSSWYAEESGLRPLLRRAELGAVRLRQVAIPDVAPEMIVNLGDGTAADLALLHGSALERVRRRRGVELASRVIWMGAAREAAERRSP